MKIVIIIAVIIALEIVAWTLVAAHNVGGDEEEKLEMDIREYDEWMRTKEERREEKKKKAQSPAH